MFSALRESGLQKTGSAQHNRLKYFFKKTSAKNSDFHPFGDIFRGFYCFKVVKKVPRKFLTLPLSFTGAMRLTEAIK